jgi:hypothetical protein
VGGEKHRLVSPILAFVMFATLLLILVNAMVIATLLHLVVMGMPLLHYVCGMPTSLNEGRGKERVGLGGDLVMWQCMWVGGVTQQARVEWLMMWQV